MNNDQLTQDLLQAMSIVAQRAVSTAGYDKTIQATIVSCVDATIGKYKVSYQDGSWYAYSSNTNTTYTKGSNVYILVPGGDMTKDKTILGTTKQLGINYINTLEADEGYAANGNSTVTDSNIHELCSYQTGTLVLYNADGEEENNVIKIDTAAASQYIKSSSHFITSALVRTNLSLEQRYNGNYGLNFYLDFKDNAQGNIVTRLYTFDVNSMEGNPYTYTTAVTQKAVFQVDGINFQRIVRIEAFVKDFPNQKADQSSDIFISGITFTGATALTEEELSGVSLHLIAEKGYIFNENSSSNETRPIQAQVRVLGKPIDNNSQFLPFYWFVKDVSITSSNQYYHKYGGQGWKCLNSYKTISTNPTVVDFNSGSYIYTVKVENATTKQTRYKCVAVYNGTTISKEFSIINDDAAYTIEIESDKGTEFSYDIGNPTLTCNVSGKNISNFQYVWSRTDNTGTYSSLPDTTSAYEDYVSKIEERDRLTTGFAEGTILKNAYYNETTTNIEQYNILVAEIAELNKEQFVSNNQVIHVDIKSITNFAIYNCSVFDSNHNLIGSASITLLNKLQTEGNYSLIINNGTQVFNYNESGVSPCNGSNENPYVIPQLSFTVYDNFGEEISSDVLKNSTIQWTIPTVNTMLVDYGNGTGGIPNAAQTALIYKNKQTFTYKIADRYAINKSNNDIQLKVNYNGLILVAKTDFTFTKQGELGTNGTGFVVKIVPCDSSGNPINGYAKATTTNGVSYTYNWNHLRAELWHNGERIFNARQTGTSDQNIATTVIWSILKNTYTSSISDPTCFNINSSNGSITRNTAYDIRNLYNNIGDANVRRQYEPANIIKLTLTYNGVTYYATMPIIVCYKIDSNYDATLVENTGFRYAVYSQDGRKPSYDNREPFTIQVTTTINGQIEDISTSTVTNYSPKYQWYFSGAMYQNGGWKSDVHLNTLTASNLRKNQRAGKPSDNYNGLSVTNAVCFRIENNDKNILFLHIPIHLMLNRYGHAALNGWDGNSVSIDENGNGTILAPQIGAGKKNNDNTFTGILMGSVKNSGTGKTEDGLFGYASGVRSIFLDANTGKAEFGATGKGQIIIDPSSNEAILKSGNYSTSAKTGMQINLTEPSIKFGSGYFSVDKDGKLTAAGGGTIAGWNIGEDKLYKGKVGLSSDNSVGTNLAFWAGNATPESAPFSVNYNGYLKASTAAIGNGANKIVIGKSNDDDNASAIYYKKNALNSTSFGFYIGTDGIALGAYNATNGNSVFQVKSSGEMIARSGYIGNGTNGFTITNTAIYNNKSSIDNDNEGIFLGTNGVSLGKKGVFKVTNAGVLTATSGKIASWNITNTSINSGIKSGEDAYKDSKGNVYTTGMYFGTGGLRLGANFHVDNNGNLYANNGTFVGTVTASSGTVGGWVVSATDLSSGNISINAGGSIKHTGNKWAINNDGTASFTTIRASNLKMTGGSVSGGSIGSGATLSSGVGISGTGASSNPTLSKYIDTLIVKKAYITQAEVENLIAKKIDADYIKNKVASISSLSVKSISFTNRSSYLACENTKIISRSDDTWQFNGHATTASLASNANKLGGHDSDDFVKTSSLKKYTTTIAGTTITYYGPA